MAYRGNVKFFHQQKGYGFISVHTGPEKGQEIFVHHNQILENEANLTLQRDDEVDFDIDNDDTRNHGGKLRCINVTGGTARKEEIRPRELPDHDRRDDFRDRGDRNMDRGMGMSSSNKGSGKGGFERREGDWECSRCNCNNFAKRIECFKCGASKPFMDDHESRDGPGRSGNDGGRGGGHYDRMDHRSSDRGGGYRSGGGDRFRERERSRERYGGHRGNNRDSSRERAPPPPVRACSRSRNVRGSSRDRRF